MFKNLLLALCVFIANNAYSNSISIPKELEGKNIQLIVGYGTGGTMDIFARYLAKHIKDNYNLNVIVNNRPGAGGALGTKLVADSEGDGTTIHIANDAFVLGVLLSQPGWPKKDELVPVANLWNTYNMVLASSHVKLNDFTEILNDVKKRPAAYNYGTAFVIDGLIFSNILRSYGINGVAEIPFKSGQEVKNALANNTVQFWITGVGDGINTVSTGTVKPLAVTSPQRLKELNNVPTLKEIIPDSEFKNVTTIYLPANANKETISFYNKLFEQISKNNEVKKHFAERYFNIIEVANPEKVKQDWDNHWKAVAKSIGK